MQLNVFKLSAIKTNFLPIVCLAKKFLNTFFLKNGTNKLFTLS